MSKIWNEDQSLFATIGRNKAGEYSVTVYMAGVGDPDDDQGEYYPPIGIMKFDGFPSKDSAISAATEAMVRDRDDEEAA